ncbi:hypothetical protein RHMOL_Rhmol04G0010800 [Rhododendron molle]|uniref:Uncharacterized protein n=1 Tax=Rhododendron molle TaxID=49168 RepID=A0ACC0NVV5_RHOML|nr:hypothetical protein RHMOL_Rhmol04G0010800 [Rhododendron molle]
MGRGSSKPGDDGRNGEVWPYEMAEPQYQKAKIYSLNLLAVVMGGSFDHQWKKAMVMALLLVSKSTQICDDTDEGDSNQRSNSSI